MRPWRLLTACWPDAAVGPYSTRDTPGRFVCHTTVTDILGRELQVRAVHDGEGGLLVLPDRRRQH